MSEKSFEIVLDVSVPFKCMYFVSGWIRENGTVLQHGSIPNCDDPRNILSNIELVIPINLLSKNISPMMSGMGIFQPFKQVFEKSNIPDALSFEAIFLHDIEDYELLECSLRFIMELPGLRAGAVEIDISALNNDRIERSSHQGILRRFDTHLHEAYVQLFGASAPTKKFSILDLGGRARSGVQHSAGILSDYSVTVVDIHGGDGVDVVADAHDLSSYFPSDTFDGVFCNSVFEHLHSPWKCVIEINKVLKPGGIVLILTHQTIGMHDLPCDYLRFSEYSWASFWNETTGFEILEAGQDIPSFIVPFIMRPDKKGYIASAGFELSYVLAKKISETRQVWHLASKADASSYPQGPDGSFPDRAHFLIR